MDRSRRDRREEYSAATEVSFEIMNHLGIWFLGWGPIRVGAHMGPPGQVLAGPDMSDFRRLVEFRTLWVQTWVFDGISTHDSAWSLLEKLKKHVVLTKKIFDQKSKRYPKNQNNM